MLANLCAGTTGNTWPTAAELGNALPLRLGFTLVWSGWDAGAPKATGLSLDAPVATDNGKPMVRRIREEFVSGTRLGALQAFRLSHEAAGKNAALTVRRTQTGATARRGVRVRRCAHRAAGAGGNAAGAGLDLRIAL